MNNKIKLVALLFLVCSPLRSAQLENEPSDQSIPHQGGQIERFENENMENLWQTIGIPLVEELKRKSKYLVRLAKHRAKNSDETDKIFRRNLSQEVQCTILTGLMLHPYRTPYGNVYEYKNILHHLNYHSHTDPLNRSALTEDQLSPDKEMESLIKAYIEVYANKEEKKQLAKQMLEETPEKLEEISRYTCLSLREVEALKSDK